MSVRRWGWIDITESGLVTDRVIGEVANGELVLHSDYLALEAEAKRYREALEKIADREHIKGCGVDYDGCDCDINFAKQALTPPAQKENG